MGSCAVVDRDAVTAAFDALDAAVDGALGLDFGALTTRERLALLERCERVRRRVPAVEQPLINQLVHHATPEELGGKLSHAIAEWTLISRAEAGRRIREAADLGPGPNNTRTPWLSCASRVSMTAKNEPTTMRIVIAWASRPLSAPGVRHTRVGRRS